MMDVVELIDQALARWSKRELVSVTEITDVLLDLRAMACDGCHVDILVGSE